MIVLLSSFHPNFQIQQQNLCNCHLYKPKKFNTFRFFYTMVIYIRKTGGNTASFRFVLKLIEKLIIIISLFFC